MTDFRVLACELQDVLDEDGPNHSAAVASLLERMQVGGMRGLQESRLAGAPWQEPPTTHPPVPLALQAGGAGAAGGRQRRLLRQLAHDRTSSLHLCSRLGRRRRGAAPRGSGGSVLQPPRALLPLSGAPVPEVSRCAGGKRGREGKRGGVLVRAASSRDEGRLILRAVVWTLHERLLFSGYEGTPGSQGEPPT